jgi:hypothetical protein
MELVAGRSLAHAAPLPPPAVAAIGLRVLEALGAAHARGFLHRDVKPTNILLADDGRVVLTDFGIASLEGDPALTRTGDFVGSPGFVAPERLRERPVGPASDLWSLGASLYSAVEGRPPFARATPAAALGAVLTDEAPPPVRAGPLAPVIARLLDKNPDTRISADETARALGRVAAGLPSGLPAPPHAAPAHRRRAVVPLAAAAAVLLAATLATVAFRARGADHPHARSSASPAAAAPASPSTAGRYVRPFDFCALLTPDQVTRLVPHASKVPDAHSCAWTAAARHQAVSVSAESVYDPSTETAAEDPWTATPGAARASYDQQYAADSRPRSGIAWGWDEIGVRRTGARQSAARRVSGVGEAAYLTETSQKGTVERADVTFRDSNLYLSVWFVAADGSGDAARIRAGALDAARWVSQALRRMP